MLRTLACVLLPLTLSLPSTVFAFERTVVTGDPSTPLFWRLRTIRLSPLYDSARDLTQSEVAGALERSIASWNTAGVGCSDLELIEEGWASGLATNLDGGAHDSENRIRWRDDVWPDEVGATTLALTTIVYRASSGQILDADIDVNGVDFGWSVAASPAASLIDAENTLTHELGHLVGLGHVLDPAATMYAESAPGDIEKRSLSDDELEALCVIYPRGGPTPGAPGLESQPLRGACALSVGGPTVPSGEGIALVLCLIVLRRRLSVTPRGRRIGKACASTRAGRRRGAATRGLRDRPPTG